MPPIINKEKCIKCRKCLQICTMDVFGASESKDVPEIQYPEECWHCRACVIDCPADAIQLRYPIQMSFSFKKVN
ncbi:ferredoxin family protein [Peptococcus simiae]|uniref:4Fe-4S dicluster domain-containing protein n=1 Tax=Peptococcus simiae TaxID=1643805 RepID=UPI00397F6645